MLLGQLYYYDKCLAKIPSLIAENQFEEIEILGLEFDIDEVFGLEKKEAARMLRDKFSISFLQILKENKLSFAHSFWGFLTSPTQTANTQLSPQTEYQTELVTWLEKGSVLDDLKSIIKSGQLATSEDGFAIYYGIHVLQTLTLADPNLSEIKSINKQESELNEVEEKPQILVITDHHLAPLFTNINCVFQDINQSVEQNLHHAKQVLQKETQISLVLIVSLTPAATTTYQALQHRLGNKVFVTSLDFSSQNDKNSYFDEIVKKTLGVRLV